MVKEAGQMKFCHGSMVMLMWYNSVSFLFYSNTQQVDLHLFFYLNNSRISEKF
jgi:hypothetical protein